MNVKNRIYCVEQNHFANAQWPWNLDCESYAGFSCQLLFVAIPSQDRARNWYKYLPPVVAQYTTWLWTNDPLQVLSYLCCILWVLETWPTVNPSRGGSCNEHVEMLRTLLARYLLPMLVSTSWPDWYSYGTSYSTSYLPTFIHTLPYHNRTRCQKK